MSQKSRLPGYEPEHQVYAFYEGSWLQAGFKKFCVRMGLGRFYMKLTLSRLLTEGEIARHPSYLFKVVDLPGVLKDRYAQAPVKMGYWRNSDEELVRVHRAWQRPVEGGVQKIVGPNFWLKNDRDRKDALFVVEATGVVDNGHQRRAVGPSKRFAVLVIDRDGPKRSPEHIERQKAFIDKWLNATDGEVDAYYSVEQVSKREHAKKRLEKIPEEIRDAQIKFGHHTNQARRFSEKIEALRAERQECEDILD